MSSNQKRVKHRKQHKGRIRGNAERGSTISFGSFGLKSLEPIWITNRQIEGSPSGASPSHET